MTTATYEGETRKFGEHTVTTELRVLGEWMAFLDGNRAKWEAGRTEAEAIGRLVISHSTKGAP